MSEISDNSGVWKTLGLAIGAIAVVCVIGLASCGSWVSPQAQTIYVVRNGGPLDNKNIRQVIKPGSGWTWTGILSTAHAYPDSTQQRLYTITSDPTRGDRPGVDVVTVPTQDGVSLGIEGTFYFTTAFDGSENGVKTVEAFDNQFGTRTFPVAGTNGETHAWSGSNGWSAFLDSVVRPVINNELRIAVGSFKCYQLVSSCALVSAGTASSSTADVASVGQTNQTNIQKIEDQINTGLNKDLQDTLKGDYFLHVRFLLSKPDLPTGVQNAVDDVQAARVEVATAAAHKQQAIQNSQANAIQSKAYQKCPACAEIDQIKALKNSDGNIGANVYIGIQPSGPIAGGTTTSTKSK